MKILVDKALRILKKMPKIIKSIKKTENDEKNSNFNLRASSFPRDVLPLPMKPIKKI